MTKERLEELVRKHGSSAEKVREALKGEARKHCHGACGLDDGLQVPH
jgi:hypothetical protein